MNAHMPTRGSGSPTAVPSTLSARTDEPGAPAGGDPWDARSWALLTAGAAAAAGADTAEGGPAEPSPQTQAQRPARARSGPADPVRELMHRHRALCERAVDPLEIAAELEAHGVTDRTAARFRHRDVFSLAEELFARVPREEEKHSEAGTARDAGAQAPAHDAQDGCSVHGAHGADDAGGPQVRAAGAVAATSLALVPGALTAVALALFALSPLRSEGPPATAAFAVAAVVTVGAAVRLALRRVVRVSPDLLMAAAVCWLAFGAVLGDRTGTGTTGAGQTAVGSGITVPLSLAFALAPGLWCARWFAARAGRRLSGSRSLDEFAAATRPLLTTAVLLFAAALPALQVVIGQATAVAVQRDGGHGTFVSTVPGTTTALGVLLFVALLLTAHGFGAAVRAGLGTACVLQTLALAVEAATASASVSGPGPGLPAVACGCAAVGLLVYAYRALAGASAHRRAYRTGREGCYGSETCEDTGDGAH